MTMAPARTTVTHHALNLSLHVHGILLISLCPPHSACGFVREEVVGHSLSLIQVRFYGHAAKIR